MNGGVVFQYHDKDAMRFITKCNEDNLTNAEIIERAKQEGGLFGYNGLKETGEEERFKLPYSDEKASERYLCARTEDGQITAPYPAVMLTFTPENRRNAKAYHEMLARKRAERTPEQVEADDYRYPNSEPATPSAVDSILRDRRAFLIKYNKEWPSHWKKKYDDAYWEQKKISDSSTEYTNK